MPTPEKHDLSVALIPSLSKDKGGPKTKCR